MTKQKKTTTLFFAILLILAGAICTYNKNQQEKESSLNRLTSKTTFYIGQQKRQPAMVEGEFPIDDYHPDGGQFWKTMLTVNGKKQAVVAYYERMGIFTIYTTEPTDKSQGFIYSGLDYKDYLGKKDLDDLKSKSTPDSQ
ncbi:hypothetical protein [Fructobacillus fructosus]|uniref:hypothetical protein n=1 Tax=Fructobacillus fructosus TaxID=1631 RepID=UPI002DB4B28D|nr:unnamed protein product [Fructobacillus fructosus]CAK1248439.1 unnamed protein product [Fructobacillus fructosus]CAK1249217.1 unnamed protein product [Fructobacillus fructosus]